MKRFAMVFLAGTVLLLSGCATTIRSNVTAFHNWPADLPDKTYVLEPAASPQDDTLEFRSYQNLVRAELARQGFQEVTDGTPTLGVSMRFMTTVVPVRVIQVDHPHIYTSARLGYLYPRRRGYWGGWYGPFWHDPFWYGMPYYTETIQHHYLREVHVSIKSRRDNRRLYDVTVRNQSRIESSPSIMPLLVASAFAEFPGPSGVSRVIEYKLEPKK